MSRKQVATLLKTLQSKTKKLFHFDHKFNFEWNFYVIAFLFKFKDLSNYNYRLRDFLKKKKKQQCNRLVSNWALQCINDSIFEMN